MSHLQGLRRGDPVIYERLGELLDCKFIELAVVSVSGKIAVAVWHEDWGLFLAPPSLVKVSGKMERVL